jgi:hypothetical protein
MSARTQGARVEYAPGEAWCIAADRVVLVCERDLAPQRAAALHAEAGSVASLEQLRALIEHEPTALIALVDVDGSRELLRRHGVPASADDAPLADRFGLDWSLDEVAATRRLAAGSLGALDAATLPLEGGVVRAAAVRVAPRPPDASADAPQAAPVADTPATTSPSTGAFGQTQPPVEAAAARTDTGNPIGGLIDSVPGFIKPAADVRELQPEAPAPAAPASPPAPEPAPAARDFGDHDGLTITAEQARRLQAERAQPAGAQPPQQPTAEPTAAAPATGPLVLSTLCPNGHVNAPGTTTCIRCGAAIDEASAAQRRRPEVAVAVLVSGERIPLGRGVVIGRRPRSRRVEDGRVPRLITVDSPGEDISRSHVELRVDDWNLVAVDLSSTNGTLLLREGAAPQRLRPEASTILQLGDRLDLGDGQVVTIESAP